MQLDQIIPNVTRLQRLLVAGKNVGATAAASTIIKNIFDNAPTLGLDLDGTIDENPEFFRILSQVWPGAVIIVTCRDNRDATVDVLKQFGIHYDDLVLVKRLQDKAAAIAERNIKIYIDDQDECLQDIPDSVTVLKIRNGGNFEDGRWLYQCSTGKSVGY